jgi:Uri superfamily endonuclease
VALQKKVGTYALVLGASAQSTITVGKIGKIKLHKGHYLYVGSAFGPGGVRARVKRHCCIRKPRHWHIDYIRPALKLSEVWYTYDPQKQEHRWADILMGIDDMQQPLKGFGASDCQCNSHLFFSISPIRFKEFHSLTEMDSLSQYRIERIKIVP